MSFDELEKHFNIEPTPQPEVSQLRKATEITVQKDDLDKDYLTVRDNLKELINKGTSAIDGILNLASETEQPRAYEVLAQLIKTVAETNKDLLDMHNKMKVIKGEPQANNTPNSITTNNSIFVGSTADLQKLLRGKMKEIEKLENNGDIIDAE
jgi:predicted transcriptional regulator